MYEDDQSVQGEKKEETTYETHKAEADVLFKQGEFRKATLCYTASLDKIDEARGKDAEGGGKHHDPKDQEKYEQKMAKDERDIFVARSKCHLKLGNAAAALLDAENSLVEDKQYIKGLYQKAEALYYQGEFEPALVQFHRGKNLRPEMQEFRLGIQKSEEAINNCIGTPESVKLENKGDLTDFYKNDEDERNKSKKKTAYSKARQQDDKKKQQKERPKSVGKNNKTVKELLGDLYQDREYLDSLWREEDAKEKKVGNSQKIQDLCLEGINHLDSRTEFWRQQKPMYARKRERMLRQQQWNKGSKKQDTKQIMRNIEEIDDDQANGDYANSLKKAKRTARTLESMTEEDCSNKMELLANVYSYIGNSYLEMSKYDPALENHQKDLDIANEKDLEDCRSRALDNLGRVYARMGKFAKAAETWEKKLPLSKSALESTWLYHEIGRCYLERELFEKAHDYGMKSMNSAEEASDGVWQLNASVLIAQSEVKMEQYEEASESFQKSLEMAKHLDDAPVEVAIRRALADVDRKLVEIHRKEEKDDQSERSSEKGSRPASSKSNKSHKSDKSDKKADEEKQVVSKKTPTPEPEPETKAEPEAKSEPKTTPEPEPKQDQAKADDNKDKEEQKEEEKTDEQKK